MESKGRDIKLTAGLPPSAPPDATPPEGDENTNPSLMGYAGLIIAVIVAGLWFIGGDEEMPPNGTAETFDAAAHGSGPFSYRFSSNERLTYRLDARAHGAGFDDAMGASAGLTLGTDLILHTEAVDERGVGTVHVDFENVFLKGNFMGDAVDLWQRDRPSASAPVIAREPITMTVAPNGLVLDVVRQAGVDLVLSPVEMLVPLKFPTSYIEVGDTWASEFSLPVPGVGAAMKATARNTLTGFETTGGSTHAVIHQEIQAAPRAGFEAPSGTGTNEPLIGIIPSFELRGENILYFDIDAGKLVFADIDMVFTVDAGDALKPITDLANTYYTFLDSMEEPGKASAAEQAESLLDTGITIKATLTRAL